MAVVVDLVAGAATLVGAVSTEEVPVVASAAVVAVFVAAVSPPNTLEAEPGAAVVALALAVPVLAAFAQARICMEALILLVEVLADQPVHSDTTTEAARLLLGHTNSADGETNR